ncbi:alpha/beta hydrolase [Litoreibacter sp.]|nr:alpha/beta hydrolase [Litoreibacter sp.]
MSFPPAPLHADVAFGPDDGQAYWLTCSDGVKIRAAVWGVDAGTKGTVLLFPGRTEFIEKYGRAAGQFASRGYTTLVIDWRGQGLADRLIDDPALGHVGEFLDYQKDIAAVLELVDHLKLPKPLSLFAHSMGGCIGLRALTRDLPVTSAVFTGPMWGISLAGSKRYLAWIGSTVAHNIGLGNTISPGTLPTTYVLSNPFADNMLTKDLAMFERMKDQVEAYPDLALGGPTLSWLNEALNECKTLRAHPTPNVPCQTFLGSNERIVDPEFIHDRMSRWPNGELTVIEDGEHEIAMENDATQTVLFDGCDALYSTHRR